MLHRECTHLYQAFGRDTAGRDRRIQPWKQCPQFIACGRRCSASRGQESRFLGMGGMLDKTAYQAFSRLRAERWLKI